MTAKIEPWMKLAAEHIEDAYTVAIQQQVVGTEPAVVEVAYIIAAHAPKETNIKPDNAQAAIKQEPSVPISKLKELRHNIDSYAFSQLEKLIDKAEKD